MEHRLLIALVFAATIASAQPAPDAPVFTADPDVRVSMSVGELNAALGEIAGYTWSAEWTTGTHPICSSPTVHLKLQQPALIVRSWQDPVDASSGIETILRFKPEASVDDSGCPDVRLAAYCSGITCSEPIFGKQLLLLSLRCTFFGFPIASEFFDLPNPLNVPDSIDARLPPDKPHDGEDEVTNLAFVTRTSAGWAPARDPKRRSVPLVSQFHAVGGRPLLQTCASAPEHEPFFACDPATLCGLPRADPWTVHRRDATHLGVDVHAGAVRGATLENWSAFERADAARQPVQTGDFVGLRFSAAFLRGDSASPGFAERILPIRVSGKRRAGDQWVEFELYLTAARATFGKFGGADAIHVQFEVQDAKAWLMSNPSVRASVSPVNASAVFSLPAVKAASDETAVISVALRQLSLGLSTRVGNVELCHQGDLLEDAFPGFLEPFARIAGAKDILPKCVEIGDNRFEALGSCGDGVSRRGRLSSESRNLSLQVDLTQTRTSLNDEGWVLSLPRKRE